MLIPEVEKGTPSRSAPRRPECYGHWVSSQSRSSSVVLDAMPKISHYLAYRDSPHPKGRTAAFLPLPPSCGDFPTVSLTRVGHCPGSVNDPGTSNTIGGLGGVPSNARRVWMGLPALSGRWMGVWGPAHLPHIPPYLAAYLGLVNGHGGSLAPWMDNHLQTLASHYSPSVPFPRRCCALGSILLWCGRRKFSTKSTRVWRLRPIKPPASPGIAGARLRRRKFFRETILGAD